MARCQKTLAAPAPIIFRLPQITMPIPQRQPEKSKSFRVLPNAFLPDRLAFRLPNKNQRKTKKPPIRAALFTVYRNRSLTLQLPRNIAKMRIRVNTHLLALFLRRIMQRMLQNHCVGGMKRRRRLARLGKTRIRTFKIRLAAGRQIVQMMPAMLMPLVRPSRSRCQSQHNSG